MHQCVCHVEENTDRGKIGQCAKEKSVAVVWVRVLCIDYDDGKTRASIRLLLKCGHEFDYIRTRIRTILRIVKNR